jgi:ribosomal protein S21
MAIVVSRQPNDTDDKIISRFRKIMVQSSRVDDIKELQHHLKPSARRNRDKQSKRKRRPLSAY